MIPPPVPSDWEVRWHPAKHAKVRLVCLPHAGGGSVAYQAWAEALAPDIEVVAIRLPGRESRFRERPYTRLDDLVGTLVKDLAPLLDRPYAWFGHSMGALIAFELCRVTRALGLRGPERLLVSGRPAPHLPPRGDQVHAASDQALIARLRANGGTPDEILDDPVTMRSLMPMLRADYTLTETYAYTEEESLDCPLSVFGGTEDPLVTGDDLRAWRRHTRAGCTTRTFSGGHFYLHDDPGQLLPLIAADVLSHV